MSEGWKFIKVVHSFKELPLDEFHDNVNKNGNKTKRSDCKTCNLKRQREARKKKQS